VPLALQRRCRRPSLLRCIACLSSENKNLVALVLVLAGTNLFTFATTRYLTTKDVLTQAQERMNAALKKEGLYEEVFPDDRARSVAIVLAIPLAGGMYYWWNDGLKYWGAAIVFILSGLAVTRYETRRKNAG
jgi:hypothetical protein